MLYLKKICRKNLRSLASLAITVSLVLQPIGVSLAVAESDGASEPPPASAQDPAVPPADSPAPADPQPDASADSADVSPPEPEPSVTDPAQQADNFRDELASRKQEARGELNPAGQDENAETQIEDETQALPDEGQDSSSDTTDTADATTPTDNLNNATSTIPSAQDAQDTDPQELIDEMKQDAREAADGDLLSEDIDPDGTLDELLDPGDQQPPSLDEMKQDARDVASELKDEARDDSSGPDDETSGLPGGPGGGSGEDGADVNTPGQPGDDLDEDAADSDDQSLADEDEDEADSEDGNDEDAGSTDDAEEISSEDEQVDQLSDPDPEVVNTEDSQTDLTGGNDGTLSEDGASITTGDATTDSEITTNANTNQVDFGIEEAAAAEDPDDPDPEKFGKNDVDDVELNVDNSNSTEAVITVGGSSNTGDNTISGEDGNGSIATGQANAIANILNFINTNIVGGPLFQLVLIGVRSNGDDIAVIPEEIDSYSGSCGVGLCAGVIDINNENTAFVLNDVTLEASSGNNTISGEDVEGAIQTGDANALANVVNIVNTNLIGTTWVLAIVNILGDWAGNLFFPEASEFAATDSSGNLLGEFGEVTINNSNAGAIENNVSIDATSGENAITGATTTSASVATGEVNSATNVTNVANTNLVNASLFLAFLNILGGWTGQIIGMPSGFTMADGDNGQAVIANLPVSDQTSGWGDDDFTFSANNSNDGTIVNNVSIEASSGNNTIEGTDEASGSIATGDVNAFANIFNLLNTNIIGGAWYLTVLNVMGTWSGNMIFGTLDLSITKSVQVERLPAGPGDTVSYTLEFSNNGTATVPTVTITDSFDAGLLEVLDIGSGELTGPGTVQWTVEDFAPGQTGSISYLLKVKQDLSEDAVATNSVAIEPSGVDQNQSDNFDAADLSVSPTPGPSTTPLPSDGNGDNGNGDNGNGGNGGVGGGISGTGGGGGLHSGFASKTTFKVTKTNSADGPVKQGDPIDYTITIKNTGDGVARDVVAIDTMVGPDGKIVSEDTWPLESVLAGEEILITYTIIVDGKVGPLNGPYSNTLTLSGRNPDGSTLEVEPVSSTVVVGEKEDQTQPGEGAGGEAGGTPPPSDEQGSPIISTPPQFQRAAPKISFLAPGEAFAAGEEVAEAPPTRLITPGPVDLSASLLKAILDNFKNGVALIILGLALLLMNGLLWARERRAKQ